MARKGKSTAEIIGFLREAEVRIAQGETAGKICRGAGISEQTYYKWRREYGGLKIDQAKRLKELERENERLKKAVSELTLDKQILQDSPLVPLIYSKNSFLHGSGVKDFVIGEFPAYPNHLTVTLG